MSIGKEKQDTLVERMKKLGIREGDLIEKFILGSGKGGQKINKTSSCVYLKHIPSGIEIKCQRDRSRELNRYLAKKELCEKLEEKFFSIESAKQKRLEKIRRQKRRRKRKTQEKLFAFKKKRGEIKKLRKPPN